MNFPKEIKIGGIKYKVSFPMIVKNGYRVINKHQFEGLRAK